MKTKIILHGGFASTSNSQNDLFFQEILKNIPDAPKILLVFFSKEEDKIAVNRDEDIAQFERNKGRRNISYDTAIEAVFLEQVKWADIIYFHGGNTLKLLDTLKKFNDLKKAFEGKTIAGESAGAYALSAHFHSKRAGGVFEGLGLVPASTVCHYSEQRKEAIKDLPKDKEVLLLSDYTYKVFEI